MPLCIFPEGVMNNNKYLMPFKKGAFETEASVKPVAIKYDYDIVSPQTFLPLAFPIHLLQCTLWNSGTVNLTHLPIFVPTEYLFKTHADKGKERWEIYAWAIRDIISKVGELPLYECSTRHQMNYARKIIGMKTFDCPEE